jgi:uncharacterized protein (DUF1684 family)
MEALELADWRARIARLYLSALDLAEFREARDELFATHPQSPIPPRDRSSFTGLRYFPENPDARRTVTPRPAPAGGLELPTGGPDGVVRYRRVALLDTPWGVLTLWWIDAYGGGLFLPFRDATCGRESYGGGRYLTDTVKGTHGRGMEVLPDDRVIVDFNYAYNPSCAYDSRWACPLAPPDNRLDQPVAAGEMAYRRPDS